MSVEFYWRLPLHGCQSSLSAGLNRGDWTPLLPGNIAPGLRDGRPDGIPYVDHSAEIAKAAELAGFYGALVVSFPNTEEAWTASATLARETKALRYLIAFQPNFIHPVYAAKQAATLQRISQGRVEWNIITGGGGPAQRWYGDFLPHDERYARTREFLEVVEAEFAGEPYDYKGRIFQVEKGGLKTPLALERKPKIFLSGSSDVAVGIAAKHAELLLNWLEPNEAIRRHVARIEEESTTAGRKAGYAIRLEVLARQTEEEAWREVQRGFDKLDKDEIARRYARYGGGDAVGPQRQRGFIYENVSRWEDLKDGPNRWNGFSLLRGGPGGGFVGSYQQVAERLNELIDLGVKTFILAATPHLEEAYRIGEEVLPLLRGRTARAALEAAE